MCVSEFEAQSRSISAGEYVAIEVTDSGIGMDRKTRARIFEPFFSTKSRGRGTGLGLASAYGIIKNHNGAITVDSVPGEGSTFRILLPASEEAPEPPATAADTVTRGSETILFVDDEKLVLSVGAELLKRLGYQVIIAEGGHRALEMFSQRAQDIDMVILDLIMPDLSGKDTFERLRALDPEVRVLLSSGYSADGEAAGILNAGCNGFIQKPFDLQLLSKKVREVLDNP
jgi:CheY-like chemotaxis protein